MLPIRLSHCRVLAGALFAALLCATAQAQSWEYKSYKKSQGGQYSKDTFVVGTISIEEKDGKSYFRMTAGGTDFCLRGQVPANVTRTDELTTIELMQTLPGCEAIRYVIRNDGSGGDRETRRGERWVKDGWDHGLTPRR